jgi:hypothetical protein
MSPLPGIEASSEVGASMSAEDNAALEREFEVLMAKAGANVPADRRAGVVAGYTDMKRMCALLRQPRTEADEPSNTYSLMGSYGASSHERGNCFALSIAEAGRRLRARTLTSRH